MIYGYARISDRSQEIGTQVAELEKYGCDEIVQEVITGIAEEKELNELINRLEKSDTLVACRMDRLGRSARQLIQLVDELQEKEINLVILDMNIDTATPTGKFFLQIMAAFSEMERANMKIKQKRGIALAKMNGKHLGRPRNWRKQALEEAITMYEKGRVIREIEDITQVSKATLYRELKKRGITR
ncbi:recombinase family protein [Bacillus cereus group sp. BfR-BA-01495]|uniref:recombinase family protein n=1 Tax=Bacillus cereus group sp. BfR-BA-01495 TaxID=2920363 RepID=UPI001F56ECC6|nr:recombinase family protein [Bacillus cereus group sp. BfR-BA-01495]